MSKRFKSIKAGIKGCIFRIKSCTNKRRLIGKGLRIYDNSELRLYKRASCTIGDNVKVDSNILIATQDNANLILCQNVSIGSNSMIVCHKSVTIGDNTMLGPNVYIFDHDHKYTEKLIERKNYVTKEISIGKNCWIGTGCIILKGTIIGDNCIIGAGTLLKGKYPPNSIIINKRETVITHKR